MPPYVLSGMGLVITPLHPPRRFNPLAQPLEASQKLGGRELVWNFNGGDITSDGGALVLKKLEVSLHLEATAPPRSGRTTTRSKGSPIWSYTTFTGPWPGWERFLPRIGRMGLRHFLPAPTRT